MRPIWVGGDKLVTKERESAEVPVSVFRALIVRPLGLGESTVGIKTSNGIALQVSNIGYLRTHRAH